jgi:dienelactone hydrolase
MGKAKLDEAIKDVVATLNQVKSAGKVGIVGYCWGGTCAWKSASSVDGLSASVCYYGGGIPGLTGEKPKCPVQMHFGEKDASIPMTDVDIIKQKRSGDCEIYVGTVHHASTLLDPREPGRCLCDGSTVQRQPAPAKAAAPIRRTAAPVAKKAPTRTPARAPARTRK